MSAGRGKKDFFPFLLPLLRPRPRNAKKKKKPSLLLSLSLAPSALITRAREDAKNSTQKLIPSVPPLRRSPPCPIRGVPPHKNEKNREEKGGESGSLSPSLFAFRVTGQKKKRRFESPAVIETATTRSQTDSANYLQSRALPLSYMD